MQIMEALSENMTSILWTEISFIAFLTKRLDRVFLLCQLLELKPIPQHQSAKENKSILSSAKSSSFSRKQALHSMGGKAIVKWFLRLVWQQQYSTGAQTTISALSQTSSVYACNLLSTGVLLRQTIYYCFPRHYHSKKKQTNPPNKCTACTQMYMELGWNCISILCATWQRPRSSLAHSLTGPPGGAFPCESTV